MSGLGTFGLLAAGILLIAGSVSALAALPRPHRRAAHFLALICTFTAATLTIWCTALLATARLVTPGEPPVPICPRMTALWTAPDSALLVWTMLTLTCGALAVIAVARTASRRFHLHMILTLSIIAIIALAAVIYADPFHRPTALPSAGHWTHALEQLTWLTGVAALATVFAAALAAPREPVRPVLLARWSRIAWTALTATVALSAWNADLRHPWPWVLTHNVTLITYLAATTLLHYTQRPQLASARIATVLAGLAFAAACRIDVPIPHYLTHPAIAVVLIATALRTRAMPPQWQLGSRSQRNALALVVLLAVTMLPPMHRIPDIHTVAATFTVALIVITAWCTIRDAADTPRARLECALSAVTIAGVICFCLWFFLKLRAPKLLAAWLAAGIAVTVVFDLFTHRADIRPRITRLLAHLAVAAVVFVVIIDPRTRTFAFAAATVILLAAGVISARRFRMPELPVDST